MSLPEAPELADVLPHHLCKLILPAPAEIVSRGRELLYAE